MATGIESERFWHDGDFAQSLATSEIKAEESESGINEQVHEVVEQAGIKKLNHRQRYRRDRKLEYLNRHNRVRWMFE